MSVVGAEVRRMKEKVSDFQSQELKRLKNLDFFVLDNSICAMKAQWVSFAATRWTTKSPF